MPECNASALVLRRTDLEALSDDPDDFAVDLQALAGPAAGPNGGQIFVDGFTGGRLPAKQSIREVTRKLFTTTPLTRRTDFSLDKAISQPISM